jgi:predicted DNA-binding transcriptional regulator AlpA
VDATTLTESDARLIANRIARKLLHRPVVVPSLMGIAQTAAYVGLSKGTVYRLRSGDMFPGPVDVPGCEDQWRRADLDQWLDRLKPRKRRRKPELVA